MITIKNPKTIIELDKFEASKIGINNLEEDKIDARLTIVGMWSVLLGYEALCVRRNYKKDKSNKMIIESIDLIGNRKMIKPKVINYDKDDGRVYVKGKVSFKGKQHRGVSSKQIFKINDKTIDVAVIAIIPKDE
jgi:hypothetical protein